MVKEIDVNKSVAVPSSELQVAREKKKTLQSTKLVIEDIGRSSKD